jgi:hypothetical protein
MRQIIYEILVWAIIPSILAAALLLAIVIIFLSEGYARISSVAGFCAGVLFFVVYVVSRSQAIQAIQGVPFGLENFPAFNPFNWLLLVFGFLIGFFILKILSRHLPIPVIGIITLTLSFASTTALFSYLFDINTRYPVMFFTLGILIGVVIHIMLYPKSFHVLRDIQQPLSQTQPDLPSNKSYILLDRIDLLRTVPTLPADPPSQVAEPPRPNSSVIRRANLNVPPRRTMTSIPIELERKLPSNDRQIISEDDLEEHIRRNS